MKAFPENAYLNCLLLEGGPAFAINVGFALCDDDPRNLHQRHTFPVACSNSSLPKTLPVGRMRIDRIG